MNQDVKTKLSPWAGFVSKVIEENFEDIAAQCKHRFLNSREISKCHHPDSAIEECKADTCPLIWRGGRER